MILTPRRVLAGCFGQNVLTRPMIIIGRVNMLVAPLG
jgi:hypothetical protein